MGFSVAQGSIVCTQGVLEINRDFAPCDMSLWSNGGSTEASNPDNQYSITFGIRSAIKAP